MEPNTKMQAADEQQQTQIADAPITGGVTERVTKQVRVLMPDLTSKDAGKWLTAWKTAINTFYPNRQPLYDFYTYILGMDNYLNGLIEKRHKSVLNKKLLYKKGDGVVDKMHEFMGTRAFRSLLDELMWTKRWGISGFEFVPGAEFRWVPVPRKHIKPKWQIISREQSGIEGYDYTKLDNVWIVGEPSDLGDLLSCSLASAFKKDAITDTAELIEIFGRPTQVIWYDGYNPQNLLELDSILDKAGSALRLKIPKGTEYQQHEVKGSNGTGKLQQGFIQLLNDELAVRLVGGTETTGNNNGGSNAKSKTHLVQQEEIIKSDMDWLTDWLNDPHFIKILQSYGLPVVEGGCFEFDREVDIDYMATKWEIDNGLITAGLPISKKYLYETYAIPMPAAGDDILVKPEQEQEDDDEKEDTPAAKKSSKKPARNKDKKTAKTLKADVSLADLWDNVKTRFTDFFAQARG